MESIHSALITTGTIMTNSAKIINFPEREVEQEQVQEPEYVKADIDNGYYRVANELGLALCKVHLSDRESRIVQAIILKTFGWQKATDWICNSQLSELTDIGITHISNIKKALKDRSIIITEGMKVGVNPVVSEWVLVKKESNKNNLPRLTKTPKQVKQTPKQVKITPQTGAHKRKTLITKETITKDSSNLILPAWLPKSLWNEFVQMRKSIKKPMTENAIKRMLTKLQKFQDSGINATEQLTKSIDNCYSDVYEPKTNQAQQFKAKAKAENFDDKDYGETQLPPWMTQEEFMPGVDQ